ncbi:conserved hypothetical protein-Uncharacterized ATPase [hydrothermal vent metagenome]|uniref:AAA domain-containing protein n=1 Tax=hydrothermal vent metagenome TaxID=652676 RepID=A0A1W1BXK9_9ZZZZ
MRLLDYYHDHPPSSSSYYMPRKLELPDENHINLYGVRGSGKSALVIDYLQEMDHETLLYIDFEDPNLLFSTLSSDDIEEFVWSRSMELLVLDNYNEHILESIPDVERIIITSRVSLELDGFATPELFPLDYEEFLAFGRGISSSSGFNSFLKLGTLPFASKQPIASRQELKNFIKRSFDYQELQLLVVLAIYQTHHLTIHQIYISSKSRFKVSKDWIYRKIKEFEREGVIYFIDDAYQKSGKKLILFDFALGKYLTIDQPFITQFDTIIALALIKHKREFKTLGIHGYLTKQRELITPAPFESEESIWKKSHSKYSIYKKYDIQKVTIVTVANQYSYKIDNITFEALPFYEWSILNEENL